MKNKNITKLKELWILLQFKVMNKNDKIRGIKIIDDIIKDEQK